MGTRDIFGFLGTTISIVLFTTPSLDIYRIYKTREGVDKFPYLLFLSLIMNCLFWALYGLTIDSTSIQLCNLYGLIANNIYIILYIQSTSLESNKKNTYIIIILLSQISLLFLFYLLKPTSLFYGLIANFFNILATASTAQNIKQVINNKDISYIAINVVFVYFLNSFIWICYSISIGWDFFIFIPNLIGDIVCGIQIYLYFLYRKEGKVGSLINEEGVGKGNKDHINNLNSLYNDLGNQS